VLRTGLFSFLKWKARAADNESSTLQRSAEWPHDK
jgi:hypothetical protein